MSQNKTVVPGMDGGNSYSTDFYSKNTKVGIRPKGTVVPGMEQNVSSGYQSPNSNLSHSHGKPVAGFLYSISRQGIGEYWPLYQGQNTIGSSPNCDVCLREGTVSGEHAVLVVRKMKNPEKTIASISDARSTNGTMINGESLGFSAKECFNGDIITIGENYELVVILVDVKALGLKVATNFIPIQEGYSAHNVDKAYESNEPTQFSAHKQPYYGTDFDAYPPRFHDGAGTDGTVGLDGNDIVSGGTIGM